MKRFISRFSLAVVFLFVVSVLLTASNAYASYPPYLDFYGWYDYSESGELSVSYITAEGIEYKNGDYDCTTCDNADAVLGADIKFDPLTKSGSAPLFSGPVSFFLTKDGTDFFTADLSDLVTTDIDGIWSGRLTNVNRNGSAPYSRYISETGSGDLMLFLSFNTMAGPSDDFTAASSGNVSGMISVAPEPVSAILFIAGGATLAFRRQRRSA